MPKYFWFNVCLLLLPYSIRAQTVIEPEWLTIEDGLSQGYVGSIMEDSDGFLWMGTKNGLNRYDGEHFKAFTHDPSDPYSVSGDFISALHDFGAFILVGTENAGLNLFHKRTNRFYRIPLQEPSSAKDFLGVIEQIEQDRFGQIWLNTSIPDHTQLYRLRFPDNFQKQFPQQITLLDSLEMLKISNTEGYYSVNFVVGKDHLLTLNELGQLWKVDIQSGEAILSEEQTSLENRTFTALHKLSDGSLIAVSFASHESAGEITLFKDGRWNKVAVDFDFDAFGWLEEKKQFWLWTNGRGVLVYDEKSLNKKSLKFQESAFSIAEKATTILASTIDKSGNIWLGTPGYGALKVTPRKTKIKSYFEGMSIYAEPFVSRKGDVLINPSKGRNLFIHGHQSNIYQTLFPHLSKTSTTALDNKAGTTEIISKKVFESFLIQDKNRTFWEVSVQHITQIEKDGSRTIKQKTEVNFAQKIYDPILHSIFYFNYRNFFQYDIEDDTISVHRFEEIIKPGIEGLCIAKSSNGHYWLGTNQGLIHVTPNDGKYVFELLEKEENGQNGLLNNQVASVLEDPIDKEVLWIGTKGGGLHRLNTRDMSWSHINSKNGLPNDVIYGILNDDHGNLWMSSNKGIIRYTPSTGDIKNFTAADGMQSDEFNTFAYAKGPDGQMVFGGINGLNVFHPDDLQDNPVTPKVMLTELSVNNEVVTVGDSTGLLNEAIPYATEITLPFSQNNITLGFAALEYTAPSKNRFRYYLEGTEKEWVHESTENFAPYLNLSPGDYTFKIKGANGDGVWSEEVTSLKINILSPWYRTNLAYFIYLALIVLGIWRFLKFREARLRLRYNMEIERQKAERLQELDDMKSRFFTNISHEFRTPLTIISGMTDKMEEDAEKWSKKGRKMIKRNSNNLLNLVNQILDLRKLESGKLELHLIQSDLIVYLKYIFESFHSYAESKDINLHFHSEQPEVIMDFDSEKILRILSNLLSNAIKFTPEGGDVFININVENISSNNSPLTTENSLLIKVRDTGVGIPTDKLSNVFDRFFQVDDTSTRKGEGTGIGLALTHELVKLMEGDVQVISQPGKGTEFKVKLPISNNAPVAEAKDDLLDQKEVHQTLAMTTVEELETNPVHHYDSTLPTLLIAEDNPDVRQYLIACLEDQFQLQIASDGQEGIEKAIEIIPDIIISDVMMPRKNGFELCQTLKTDARTSHIPIVLLTSKSDQESRISGLERGADAYLTKPFNKKELFVRLKNLLKVRQKLQERYSSLEVLEPTPEIALQQEDEFIIKVRAAIEENLDDETFGIAELCRAVAMSRSQLHRKIKALTNRSTSQYIRSIKLFKAKELLKTTDLNISMVAFEVGFNDPKYFSRTFSEEFGIPPTDLRK